MDARFHTCGRLVAVHLKGKELGIASIRSTTDAISADMSVNVEFVMAPAAI